MNPHIEALRFMGDHASRNSRFARDRMEKIKMDPPTMKQLLQGGHLKMETLGSDKHIMYGTAYDWQIAHGIKKNQSVIQ